MEHKENVKWWDNSDQHQLHQEALNWMGFKGGEIEESCFKVDQTSIKRGIKIHGSKGNSIQ